MAAREVGSGGTAGRAIASVSARARARARAYTRGRKRVDAGGSSPVTLQPSCVRVEEGEETGIPRLSEGWRPVAGLRRQSVGGAAAHRGGSDGRDVVGGGCTPLLAKAPATNDHPWSIHGGFIRQVRPTSCRCCPRCCTVHLVHLSRHRDRYIGVVTGEVVPRVHPFVLIAILGDGACRGRRR